MIKIMWYFLLLQCIIVSLLGKPASPITKLPQIPNTANNKKLKDLTPELRVKFGSGNKLWLTNRAGEVIQVYVRNGDLQIKSMNKNSYPTIGDEPRKNGYKGLFGFYKLPAGYFIALISDASKLKNFPGEKVYKVKEIELLMIPDLDMNKITNLEMIEQEKAEKLLKKTFSRHSFYFSKGNYDITKTFQENTLKQEKSRKLFNIGNSKNFDWKQSDERFFWNFNSIIPLINANCEGFILPISNIWETTKHLNYGGKDFYFTLISRRSRRRQGPRYIMRGSDESGDVANFVETEQILRRADGKGNSSFVQIRGSIPLFWSQPDVWKLKPTVTPIKDTKRHSQAVKTHFVDLALHYLFSERDEIKRVATEPSVYFINLIDKKGGQGQLGRMLYSAIKNSTEAQNKLINVLTKIPINKDKKEENMGLIVSSEKIESIEETDGAFKTEDLKELKNRDKMTFEGFNYKISESDLKELSGLNGKKDENSRFLASFNLHYIWLDYHHKCKNDANYMKQVFPKISEGLSKQSGIFSIQDSDSWFQKGRNVKGVQKNIIRTNCMDCLDRTNVVQTTVSRWVLQKQFQILLENENKDLNNDITEDALELPNSDLEKAFRGIWTENGDQLSILYAGSRAMKRDVTRNGVRTKKGAFDDAMAAAKRYYVNNYQDKKRQEGLDLIIGNMDNKEGKLNKHIFSQYMKKIENSDFMSNEEVTKSENFEKIEKVNIETKVEVKFENEIKIEKVEISPDFDTDKMNAEIDEIFDDIFGDIMQVSDNNFDSKKYTLMSGGSIDVLNAEIEEISEVEREKGVLEKKVINKNKITPKKLKPLKKITVIPSNSPARKMRNLFSTIYHNIKYILLLAVIPLVLYFC